MADRTATNSRLGMSGLLSALIPGLGQFVRGQRYRGVSILLGFLVMLATVYWYANPIWYASPIAIWLWNIWDAMSPRSRSILLPVFFGLIAAYSIGWRVVGIDFSKASMSRAVAIVRPMLRPDFIQAKREHNEMWVNVQVPCSPEPPTAIREDAGRLFY